MNRFRGLLQFLSWLLNPLTAVHWLGVYLVLLGRVDNENADVKQWRIAETGANNAKMYNLLCESSYDFSKVMRTTFISMAQVGGHIRRRVSLSIADGVMCFYRVCMVGNKSSANG